MLFRSRPPRAGAGRGADGARDGAAARSAADRPSAARGGPRRPARRVAAPLGSGDVTPLNLVQPSDGQAAVFAPGGARARRVSRPLVGRFVGRFPRPFSGGPARARSERLPFVGASVGATRIERARAARLTEVPFPRVCRFHHAPTQAPSSGEIRWPSRLRFSRSHRFLSRRFAACSLAGQQSEGPESANYAPRERN